MTETPQTERRSDRPRRIQRKRTKGWKMPPNTVYVGRPTKWGNPYRPSGETTAATAVVMYADYLRRAPDQNEVARELAKLRGKNLACWCPEGSPCHADVLLALANGDRHE